MRHKHGDIALRWVWLWLALMAHLSLSAQTSVTHAIGIGQTNVLDTYLTPEKFSGAGYTYLNIREGQQTDKRWTTTVEHEASISSTTDRSESLTDLEASYALYWGRYHNWWLCEGKLRLQAGALVNANLGFIYSMLNSNNPAQARVSLNLMPACTATYGFRLWKQQMSARYELALPLAGVMFSPNYGQSYYEIFNRGNYDHNVVPTTPLSSPTFRQILSLDWQISRKMILRVGYLGNYQQAKVNQLKQHVLAHRLLIGIVINS